MREFCTAAVATTTISISRTIHLEKRRRVNEEEEKTQN